MSCQIVNLQPLGSGGNADLFIGQRDDNGEYVVVKYLREFGLAHARRGFAREVRILQRRLPGVVQLLAFDIEGERPYYVMPYFPGGPLVGYAGRLTDSQLLAVAGRIASTYAMLHDQLIYHGDVKPDNILVAGDGQLNVSDPLGNGFGCTVLFSENHGGTPGYWAPEVRNGGSISKAGDVYSYGATLYHLLTGQKPQDGQNFNLSSQLHLNAKIREIIAACCNHDPGSRPTMQEVLRMLKGEAWADIQQGRLQREAVVAAACVAGLVVLLVAVTQRQA